MELLDICILNSGLFLKLTASTYFSRLIGIDKTTRQSPASFVGFDAALYELDFNFLSIKSEDDAVSGHGRMRIFIAILAFFHNNIKNSKYRVCVIITVQRYEKFLKVPNFH